MCVSCMTLEDQYEAFDVLTAACLREQGYIRAVPASERNLEIILDSGADVSALPLCFADVGVPDPHASKVQYADAQGNPLRVQGARIAEVCIGPLKFYERFAISGVTSPLVSLGKLSKAGWFVMPKQSSLWLADTQTDIPIQYRHQSFCAHGTIRMLTCSEEVKALHQFSGQAQGVPAHLPSSSGQAQGVPVQVRLKASPCTCKAVQVRLKVSPCTCKAAQVRLKVSQRT